MALIDCASWKPKSNEFVFAYRFPQTNLSTYTQLIVYESQEALLFSKGQLMGKFGPGKHTLTQRIFQFFAHFLEFRSEEKIHSRQKYG